MPKQPVLNMHIKMVATTSARPCNVTSVSIRHCTFAVPPMLYNKKPLMIFYFQISEANRPAVRPVGRRPHPFECAKVDNVLSWGLAGPRSLSLSFGLEARVCFFAPDKKRGLLLFFCL
jgi:hypothetical protein